MSKMLINSYLWQSFSWFAKRSRDLFNPTGTPVNYNIMWTNLTFYCLLNCPLHHHIRCNVVTRSQSSYFTNHILFIFQIQDSKQYLIEVINIRGADWLSASCRAWYGLRHVMLVGPRPVIRHGVLSQCEISWIYPWVIVCLKILGFSLVDI